MKGLRIALWVVAAFLGVGFVAGATLLAVGEGGKTLEGVTLAAGLFAALTGGLASASTIHGNKRLNQMAEDIRLLAELTESSIEEARAQRPEPVVRFLINQKRDRTASAIYTRRRVEREIDVETIVERESQRALASLPGKEARPTFGAFLANTEPIPPQERLDFEGKVGDYAKSIHAWLHAYQTWQRDMSTLLALHLGFDNRGRVPARGVTVQVHCPDEFQEVEEVPKLKRRPERPRFERRTWFDIRNLALPNFRVPDVVGFQDVPRIGGNVSSPRYRRGSLIVEFDIAKIVHGVPEDTDDALVFRVPEDGEFTIPWQIHAENLSEPAKGELTLKVTTEVDEGPPITSLEELAQTEAKGGDEGSEDEEEAPRPPG